MRDYIKKTIQTYNDFAKRYEKNRAQFALSPFFNQFHELLPNGKVLDIGCGPGRDTKMFVDNGYEVVGLDLSVELLKIAQEKVSEATFVQGDVTDLPFSDAEFDGIWSSATLHHLKVEDMLIALKEMYRVVKTGGVVYFSTKAGNSEKYIDEEEFDGSERFFNFIDAETCKQLCTDAGFTIQDIYSKTTREVFGYMDYPRIDQGFHNVFLRK